MREVPQDHKSCNTGKRRENKVQVIGPKGAMKSALKREPFLQGDVQGWCSVGFCPDVWTNGDEKWKATLELSPQHSERATKNGVMQHCLPILSLKHSQNSMSHSFSMFTWSLASGKTAKYEVEHQVIAFGHWHAEKQSNNENTFSPIARALSHLFPIWWT